MECEVIDVKKDTPDTVCISLKVPSIDFKPGQFIMLDFPTGEDDKVVKRAYSIGSSPTRTNMSLYVKEMNGGFVSKELQNLKGSEQYNFTGPFGHFVFDEKKHSEIILMGAGSGIAPYISMLEYINDKKLNTKVKLFSSNKIEQDIIGKSVMETEAEKNNNIDLYFNLTRDEDNNSWKGKNGRIDQEYLTNNISNLTDKHFFLCGPLDFVKSMKEILFSLGIDKTRIKQEAYG